MTRDALIEENKRLRARIAELERRATNDSWGLEYLRQEQRDKYQAERGKWGIYG